MQIPTEEELQELLETAERMSQAAADYAGSVWEQQHLDAADEAWAQFNSARAIWAESQREAT